MTKVHYGSTALLDLATELREVAAHIEEWYDHKRAAALMRRSATTLERLAPLDPEIEVVRGEH